MGNTSGYPQARNEDDQREAQEQAKKTIRYAQAPERRKLADAASGTVAGRASKSSNTRLSCLNPAKDGSPAKASKYLSAGPGTKKVGAPALHLKRNSHALQHQQQL